jgi:hypothetical protein
VYDGGEIAEHLANQILERIEAKSYKNYSPATVLIINCVADAITLPSEWNDAIARVTNAHAHRGFREVFLIERLLSQCATLYGDRKSRRRRTS